MKRRVLAGFLMFVTVALAGVAAPSAALAAYPGGDAASAISLPSLPWAASVVGTLAPVATQYGVVHGRWYRMGLQKGETLNVTATVGPGETDFGLDARPASFKSPMYVIAAVGETTASETVALKVMAAQTGDYFLEFFSEQFATFSFDATTVPAVDYSFTQLHVPAKASRHKSFSVRTGLASASEDQPWYDGLTSPLTFLVEKRFKSGYRPVSSARGIWDENDNYDYTGFSARLRLSKGTYRVRARFTDAAHAGRQYTGYKRVVVR